MKIINIFISTLLLLSSPLLLAEYEHWQEPSPMPSPEQFDTSAVEKYTNQDFVLCMQVATALYFQQGKTSIEEIEAEFKTQGFDFNCKTEFSEQMTYMQPQETKVGNSLVEHAKEPQQQQQPFTPEDAVRMMQEKFKKHPTD